MRFSIRYLTEYRYDAPVSDSQNALRMRPATTPTQSCEQFAVRIDPETRIGRHVDYFGTEVVEFGIARPHDHLTIDARARVATDPPPAAPREAWAALGTEAYAEAAGEFPLPAEDAPPNGALDELHAVTAARSPLGTLRKVIGLIPDRFAYEQGITYVDSPIDHLLEAGTGVCQDFVHLALILLRRRRIAARYVSGYLWAAGPDSGADSVEVATHAWLEALLPGGDGEAAWVGADPTNRALAGEAHVKIGHGRRYGDVPPIRAYQGAASSTHEAGVTMTRVP